LAILPISLAETLAKAATTFASGSASSLSGWPTPCAMEPNTDPSVVWARKQRLSAETGVYRGNDCGLGSKVHLAGWPTPVTGNAMGSQSFEGLSATGQTPDGRKVAVALPHVATMAGWVTTTTTRDWKDSGADIKPRADGTERFDQLPRQANLAGWPTPKVSQGRTSPNALSVRTKAGQSSSSALTLEQQAETAAGDIPREVTRAGVERRFNMDVPWSGPVRATAAGDLLTGSSAGMESGGQLDPAHSRWLQMLPPEWDVYAPTVTRSTRKPRSSSSKRISPSKATVFD
jgi:hypothetical protein